MLSLSELPDWSATNYRPNGPQWEDWPLPSHPCLHSCCSNCPKGPLLLRLFEAAGQYLFAIIDSYLFLNPAEAAATPACVWVGGLRGSPAETPSTQQLPIGQEGAEGGQASGQCAVSTAHWGGGRSWCFRCAPEGPLTTVFLLQSSRLLALTRKDGKQARQSEWGDFPVPDRVGLTRRRQLNLPAHSKEVGPR